MTKEDHGKDEIYYNEVIARDEVDNLTSPKVPQTSSNTVTMKYVRTLLISKKITT